MTLTVRIIDRANGQEMNVVPLENAAARIAQVNLVDVADVRRGLLSGQAYRTVGCHYEITPESLAAYRAGKLECEYDRIAMGQ
jgi:hypothetical protein